MTSEIVSRLNNQIKMELYSAYFYLYIGNYYYFENLDGFSNWFMVQASEERDHAFILMDYLRDNDHRIVFESIDAPGQDFQSFADPLNAAYSHEKNVTKSIHAIYALAMENRDFRTMQFLDWFVKEQTEEEKTIRDICGKFQLFGNDSKALYLLDNELMQRVYTQPAPLAERGQQE